MVNNLPSVDLMQVNATLEDNRADPVVEMDYCLQISHLDSDPATHVYHYVAVGGEDFVLPRRAAILVDFALVNILDFEDWNTGNSASSQTTKMYEVNWKGKQD